MNVTDLTHNLSLSNFDHNSLASLAVVVILELEPRILVFFYCFDDSLAKKLTIL